MNAIVQFQPPRLPYAPIIEERFGELGVNKTSWKALTEAVWPNAKTADGVIMALSYCQARKLDPFKKPVHIVPVWSSALGREVEGVWPGIAELRTTAMRTGQYAGCDETEFGPSIEREFTWSDKRGAHKATVTFPEWARCTLYRMVGRERVAFVGPKVRWLEAYATVNRSSDAPNDMWRKRPEGQLEKCAEAAALRKAFPEELGNEYAAEEMAGRVIGPDGGPINSTPTPEPKRTLHASFEDVAVVEVEDHDPATGEVIEAEAEPVDPLPAEDLPVRDDSPEPSDFPGDQATEPEQPALDGLGLKTGAQLAAEKEAEAEFDPLQWAADFNADLEGMDIEEIEAALADPSANANFDALKAKSPGAAEALNKAIGARQAALKKAARQ